MKLLALADIHGKQKHLEPIAENIKRHRPDALILAGDIASRRTHLAAVKTLSDLSLPILYVRGNADPSDFARGLTPIKLWTDLHLNPTVITGIPFIGLSGAVPIPFYSKIRLQEKSLLAELRLLMHANGVLITHTPPRGSLDRVLGRFHAGSRGLADFIDSVQPRLVICGHIHEDAGVAYRGSCCIVNCSVSGKGNGVLITLGDDTAIEEITPL